MNTTRALRELLLALGSLAFGLVALPGLVYLVGQRLVGDYPGGVAGLYAAIGDALISGNLFALILVLSPYLCIQLVRLCFRLRPAPPTL